MPPDLGRPVSPSRGESSQTVHSSPANGGGPSFQRATRTALPTSTRGTVPAGNTRSSHRSPSRSRRPCPSRSASAAPPAEPGAASHAITSRVAGRGRPRPAGSAGDVRVGEQHRLDLTGVHVDPADDQHVVAAAGELAHPHRGAAVPARDVWSSVAMSPVRYRRSGRASLVSVVKASSPSGPSGTGSPVTGSSASTQEVVLLDVQPAVRVERLAGHARPDDLRQAVDVERAGCGRSRSISARSASVHGSAPWTPTRRLISLGWPCRRRRNASPR